MKEMHLNDSLLDISFNEIKNEIKSDAQKPETKDKASFYLMKIETLDSTFKKFVDKIESVSESQNNTRKLFEDLKNKIINKDSIIKKEINDSFDLIDINDKYHSRILINSLYKNKARILRNLAARIYSMQTSGCTLIYDKFQAIASQNSMHFKPHQQLEIYAGVGAFNISSNPKIIIDGQLQNLNAEGVVEYKANVGNKKGKFSKRLMISFVKPDGRTETLEKEIIYSVD